jgi:hypothetical protein
VEKRMTGAIYTTNGSSLIAHRQNDILLRNPQLIYTLYLKVTLLKVA